MGAIQNFNLPGSSLKKKHSALYYHFVREHVAKRIVDYFHIPSKENWSNYLTKTVASITFLHLINVFYILNICFFY